jgi:POT family proton-dependent oligopeptide transporter
MSATQQNPGALTLESIQNFTGKYPKQLWYLFGIEMWERFCFYGMRGMLTIFMVEQLTIERPAAVQQYAAIQAFIYIFTFFGGLAADKILGFKKSLFWGGLLMAIGGFIVAVSPKDFFYYGICFTVIGTGFFKPNISTMVGALYKEGDVRRESGFSLFYAGINLGAFLGGIIMIYVGLYYSWSLAFGLVGVVMCLSLIMLFITKKHLGPIGNSPLEAKVPDSKKRTLEIATYIGSLAVIPLILLLIRNTQYTDYFMLIVGPGTLLYVFYEMRKLTRAEVMKLIAALIFILFSVLFWGLFEQSGGSLALFARYNVSHDFFGFNIDPNAVNNSSNALFVILLAPLVGLLWVWLSHRKMNPMAGAKFGLGFLFLALGFFVFYLLRSGADAQGLTSLEIFTFAYLILTLGELCVSPIGLSLMTKLSPMSMQGIMMGMWFLASGFGHYVAGVLGKGIATIPDGATPDQVLDIASIGFKTLAIYGLVAGVILLALTPVLKKLMGTTK